MKLSLKNKIQLIDELITQNEDTCIRDYLSELKDIEAELTNIKKSKIQQNHSIWKSNLHYHKPQDL